ncbi:hypothetical protein BGZ99_000863, partial [Dissophora globulifera]
IEDLDLNLTCPLPTSEERDIEDDDMTNDLKQKFRRAWQNLTDVCAEYKAVKRSMRIQMVSKLDAEEAQIKAGTHPDLLAELKAIEDRREARTKVVRAQKDYLQRMWEINFQAVCKASNDQYLEGQVTARRSIIELVQSRMNKIKQEMSQSRRAAGLVTPRRLTIVRPTKVTEYDSCGESCSSYDSYSSSGSECSDCEVCIPTRHLQIPQLKIPRGLSRREVAVDLAFLFPESNPTHSRPRPADGYTASGYSRQASPEAGDDGGRRPKIGKNQQFMIDHLNDEKRRKRRVMDREMQSKTTYKTHSGSEKEGRNGDIGSEERDMEVDVDQDPDAYLPQEYEAESPTRSGLVNSPRNHSPIIVRSAPRLSSAKSARHYRPRFLPGFGPDGLQNSHKHAKRSTTNAGHMPRYPIADRQGRPWDPSRPGVAAPPVTIRDEKRHGCMAFGRHTIQCIRITGTAVVLMEEVEEVEEVEEEKEEEEHLHYTIPGNRLAIRLLHLRTMDQQKDHVVPSIRPSIPRPQYYAIHPAPITVHEQHRIQQRRCTHLMTRRCSSGIHTIGNDNGCRRRLL